FNLIAIVRSPYCLQQLAMRNRAVGVKRQIPKQIEFFGGEAHLFSSGDDPAALEIDFDLTEAQMIRTRVRWHGCSPERSTDTCKQFGSAEWLCDKIVCAGIECCDFVFFAVANRQHNDGQVGCRP